jgi:hypothetical protein
VSEAIFGLLGVVIGGVLTGVVTAWLEGRRERSEGEIARRIARSEIGQADEAIAEARKGHWPPGWHPTWSQSWAAYRRPLAATTSDAEFEALATAYGAMQLLESGLLSGQRDVTDDDLDFFGRVEESLRQAEKRLA